MTHLFAPEGLLAIERLAPEQSALIFDLDGTLAPIVPHFADAEVPGETAQLLSALSASWTVAVVTGRSVKDAEQRLGFEPAYLFGNHGAERAGQHTPELKNRQLDCCRDYLNRHALQLSARKIIVEDKGFCLALHYRQSDNPAVQRAWLHGLMLPMTPEIVLTDGHMVINVLLAGAPDKGDAMLAILEECDAQAALVVGDDDNDEPMFIKAPRESVTVRIGDSLIRSRARFRLDSQLQMNALLSMLLPRRK
jgi:trehalose 6-phosphate phosphatase